MTADAARALGASAPASTVGKAIDVLFALSGTSSPMGVSALGRAVGLPKSSVHRLARTLLERGLLEQDDQGRYRPGFGLVSLGLGVLERDPIVAAARGVLEEEARELGETVFLTAARAGRIVVLEKAEGTGFLRAAPPIGGSVPAHATAVGKLYLAFGVDQLHADPVDARTRAELEAEVERARRKGWAANRGEWIAGMSVVAAPVRVRGAMRAALAVASSSARMQELGLARVAARTVAAAERVAARLKGELR